MNEVQSMGSEEKKSDEKPGFILYKDYEKHFNRLNNEQAGQLIKGIFRYVNAGEDVSGEMDGMTGMAFSFITSQIERDKQDYDRRCETSAENGKKGGRPRKTVKAQQDDQPEDEESSLKKEVKKETVKKQAETEAPKNTDVAGFDWDGFESMFESQAMADKMKTWLQYRDSLGRFPYPSITSAISQAQVMEKKYGADACIRIIDDCIGAGYKIITWDRLEKTEQNKKKGAGNDSGSGDDYFMRLAKGEADI